MKELAKKYFASHPGTDTFFFTSDEQAFFTKQSADNHASSLHADARDVIEINRADVEGNGEKKLTAKEQKIAEAKAALDAANAAVSEAVAAADAETDDVKKQELTLAVTNAKAEADKAQKAFDKVSK